MAGRAARGKQQAAAELQLFSPAQARTLLQPLRVELLRLLAEPRGIRELAELLGETPQKVHYHLKALEAAALVRRVGRRKVRALTESIYQAVAEHFAPGPELLAMLGSGGARDSLSKGYMLALAEDLLADAAQLALGAEAEGQEHHTLSIIAQVALTDAERRVAFLAELQAALVELATKYGTSDGEVREVYRLVLACYPQPEREAAPPEPAELQ